MKSRVGLFCCDIYNTYYYRLDNHNKERKEFISNLEKIILKDNLNILYFAFITSDNDEFLDYFIEDIKYHLPDNIKLIEQFFYSGYLYEGKKINFKYLHKSEAIIYLIDKYNPVMTYYADDALDNHHIDKKIIHFVPGIKTEKYYSSNNRGLNGLNNAIEKYIKKTS